MIQIDVDRRQITASTPIAHARGFTLTGPGIHSRRRIPDLVWFGDVWGAGTKSSLVVVSLFDLASQRLVTTLLFTSQQSVPLAVHPTAMRAFLSRSPTGTVMWLNRTTPMRSSAVVRTAYFSGISGDGRRLSTTAEFRRV